jgi:CheY-like chemotaxis protein
MTTITDHSLPGILILEDDIPTTTILKIWLRGICNITAVSDGDSALIEITRRMHEGGVFDLMLFDINIPFPWNGLSLMEEIRRNHECYIHIPFVAQTAYAMPNDRDRLLEAGFSDYLAKPLEREVLVRTILKNLCEMANV